jgi:hypothetical protein
MKGNDMHTHKTEQLKGKVKELMKSDEINILK